MVPTAFPAPYAGREEFEAGLTAVLNGIDATFRRPPKR
jgi:hypothetical protein